MRPISLDPSSYKKLRCCCPGSLILLKIFRDRKQERLREAARSNDPQPTTQTGPGVLQLVNGRLERINESDSAPEAEDSNEPTNETDTRERRSRRPFRYGQRHDSGRSIRSVPAYNDTPAEDEVVLVKPRPSEDDLSRIESREPQTPASMHQSVFHHQNLSTASMPLIDASQEEPPVYLARTPDRHSLALTPSSTIGFDDANVAEAGESVHVRESTDASSNSDTPLAPRLGHRVTLSADQAIYPPTSSNSRWRYPRGPSSRTNRPRSHTTGSRHSVTLPNIPGPGSFLRGRSGSHGTNNNSSSSLVISEPLRDTLVTSSQNFVYPKGGLSPAQMSFLSSRESLALVGVQTEHLVSVTSVCGDLQLHETEYVSSHHRLK